MYEWNVSKQNNSEITQQSWKISQFDKAKINHKSIQIRYRHGCSHRTVHGDALIS